MNIYIIKCYFTYIYKKLNSSPPFSAHGNSSSTFGNILVVTKRLILLPFFYYLYNSVFREFQSLSG